MLDIRRGKRAWHPFCIANLEYLFDNTKLCDTNLCDTILCYGYFFGLEMVMN